MQILVDFENGGTDWMQCIEFSLSFFSDMVCWRGSLSVEPNGIVGLLMVLKKNW